MPKNGLPGPERFVQNKSGKRKGVILDLKRRKRRKVRLPQDNAKQKYSSDPHPLMRLSRLALPVNASSDMTERAVGAFSSSITLNTQSGYATATRHFFAAEEELGKKFASPPSESEMVFLTTFLISKGLTVPTIRSYLAGIRFYLLSMGISTPPKLPPLAEQLLVGRHNQVKNPVEVALKRTRRAISLDMLRLLGHSLAISDQWSCFEKSLRWAVFLNAFWGSFRSVSKS